MQADVNYFARAAMLPQVRAQGNALRGGFPSVSDYGGFPSVSDYGGFPSAGEPRQSDAVYNALSANGGPTVAAANALNPGSAPVGSPLSGKSPEIEGLIASAAERYGVDPAAMKGIAWIESRMNPGAKNPRSSASGLYQFINSTARAYDLTDPFNAEASADAGARLARDNIQTLRSTLGREPTAGEIYLAHQQGAGGARALLSNPNARAVDIVGRDAVRLNGGNESMSAREFASIWTRKGDAAAARFAQSAPAEPEPATQAELVEFLNNTIFPR